MRDLPWRHTHDPYKIWLSEIILQQTRVSQGLPYYNKFISHYPTLQDMASASEQEILTDWQGLGYYSRARNMHETAKIITKEHKGVFPSKYEDILKLKGVGEYTAAAISSFAFGGAYPVLDGNVYRFVSRLFDIHEPINKPNGQKVIKQGLNSIFDPQKPALFNQAIMEFGALICTPKKPLCISCPFNQDCLALQKNRVLELPHKEGKIAVKKVYHSYFVFRFNSSFYIEQRTSGIWKNLHQFPLRETLTSDIDVNLEISGIVSNTDYKLVKLPYSTIHLLSHRKIHANFYTIYLSEKPFFLKSNIFETELEDISSKYPTSVLIQKYLNTIKKDDK